MIGTEWIHTGAMVSCSTTKLGTMAAVATAVSTMAGPIRCKGTEYESNGWNH